MFTGTFAIDAVTVTLQVFPSKSVAVTVNVNVPAALGVPLGHARGTTGTLHEGVGIARSVGHGEGSHPSYTAVVRSCGNDDEIPSGVV